MVVLNTKLMGNLNGTISINDNNNSIYTRMCCCLLWMEVRMLYCLLLLCVFLFASSPLLLLFYLQYFLLSRLPLCFLYLATILQLNWRCKRWWVWFGLYVFGAWMFMYLYANRTKQESQCKHTNFWRNRTPGNKADGRLEEKCLTCVFFVFVF